MKQILIMIVAFCTIFTFAANANTKKNDAKYTETKYAMEIHCGNCKKKIESTIPYVKGVKGLKVDIETKTVWLKFDNTKTSKTTLVSEFKKIGFNPKEVKVEDKK